MLLHWRVIQEGEKEGKREGEGEGEDERERGDYDLNSTPQQVAGDLSRRGG